MTDDEPITEGRWQSRAHGGEIRVMAVVDGWVVARHKGAAPFLCHSSDWAKLYERKEVARAARDEWPGREPEYEIPLVPVCADCFKPGELVTTPSGVRVCRDCYMGENYTER